MEVFFRKHNVVDSRVTGVSVRDSSLLWTIYFSLKSLPVLNKIRPRFVQRDFHTAKGYFIIQISHVVRDNWI